MCYCIKDITLFSVLKEGRVLAIQDNPPELTLNTDTPKGWMWSIRNVEGFHGRPRFWFNLPNKDDTRFAEMNFDGIALEDWEAGKEGIVVVEAVHPNERNQRLTLFVSARSIDIQDFTFVNPFNRVRMNICKDAMQISDDDISDFSVSCRLWDDSAKHLSVTRVSGSERSFDIHALKGDDFENYPSRFVELKIDYRNQEEGVGPVEVLSSSLFRMRMSNKPLTRRLENGDLDSAATETLMRAGELDIQFERDEPILLKIEGEPVIPNGFVFEIQDFRNYNGKWVPELALRQNNNALALSIDNVSGWDWYYGTSGDFNLKITDGIRPPVYLPVSFDLARNDTPIFLAQGTQINGPNGELFEIARDGEYLPVITAEGEMKLLGVEVRSVLPGSMSNLAEGSILSFKEAVPLLGELVVEKGGLNGGDDLESDDELRKRVQVQWAEPPAHGNRSHLVKIAEQTEGVDRAFVYPSFSLDYDRPFDALGKAGVALVAAGATPAVGRNSPLAKRVKSEIEANASFTGNYEIMEVECKNVYDPSEREDGCRVDVEIQVQLEDNTQWSFIGLQNLVVLGYDTEHKYLKVNYREGSSGAAIAHRKQIRDVLKQLHSGDTIYLMGQPSIIDEVYTDEESLPDWLAYNPDVFGFVLESHPLDKDGNEIPESKLIGMRIYPICDLTYTIEGEIRKVFKDLGTSEVMPPKDTDMQWIRRFPSVDFMYPAELRIAELFNRVMDIEGISDMRVVFPTQNISPPSNSVVRQADGSVYYKTYILGLNRLAVGPLLPTATLDTGYELKGVTSEGLASTDLPRFVNKSLSSIVSRNADVGGTLPLGSFPLKNTDTDPNTDNG